MQKIKIFNAKKSSVSTLAISVAFGLCALGSTPIMAAETTGSVHGVVKSAPAGTKVIATNTANGSKATVTINADGSYDIVGLRPGNYDIAFRAPDSKVLHNNVIVEIGSTASVDGDMSKAGQEVVISGVRRRDLRTSEVATNVSQVQIAAMPQQGRNFLNFAQTAPGVLVPSDLEKKQFRSGALTANSVNLFIDGVSQKNQVIQGGISGQDSSPGNPFPQGAIQEYKVSTQNFSAEYEQAASAIITAVTRSGGNEFHGDAFVEYQSKSMIGQPYYNRNVAKPEFKNMQYGVNLGGPIIKDKLFYFASYEKREDQRPGSTVVMPDAVRLGNGTATASTTALANALASNYNGLFPKDFEQTSYFGKLTYLVNDRDTIDLTYRNREETNFTGFGGTDAFTIGSNFNQFVKEASLQIKHREANFLNEAAVDWQSSHWRQAPISTEHGIVLIKPKYDDAGEPTRMTGFDTYAKIGGTPYSQEKAQDSYVIKDIMTFTGLEWKGTHTVKVGGKVALYTYLTTEADRFNPEFLYDSTTYVFGSNANVPLRMIVADGDPRFTSKNSQVGVFVQDDWRIDKHWALNLGVRWDYESNMLNNKFATDPAVATAMRALTGFNLVFGADNYISNGTNRKPFMGAIQPRLGVSYDVNGDRNTILFGGYGRYYDRTIFDNAQLETRRASIHKNEIDFPRTAPWNPIYFTDVNAALGLSKSLGLKGEVFALNNKTEVPYTDAFNLGVRHRFGDIQTSATLSYQETKNIFSFILGNRPDNGFPCSNPAGGGEFMCRSWGVNFPGYNNLIINTNEQQAKSTALYLTAEKAYSKASGFGWTTKLDLNDARMTGWNDRFVFDWASPKYTGWHAAQDVPKWVFVGSFIKDLPWQIQVSGLLTLQGKTPQEQMNVGIPLESHVLDAYYSKPISYKQFDLKLQKEFTLPNGNVVALNGQVINAFDWVNRTYSVWGNAGGGLNAPWNGGASHKPDDATTGPARTFSVGLQYKW